MTVSASGNTVDVCIIGGGLCGVLAAHRCQQAGLTYCVIEKENDLGGVWASLANQHSHLQVGGHRKTLHILPRSARRHGNLLWQAFEAMYRWSDAYPLGPNPLAKISGPVVLSTLRRFAKDWAVYAHTRFNSTAESISFNLDR